SSLVFREKKMFSAETIIGIQDKDEGHNKLVVKKWELSSSPVQGTRFYTPLTKIKNSHVPQLRPSVAKDMATQSPCQPLNNLMFPGLSILQPNSSEILPESELDFGPEENGLGNLAANKSHEQRLVWRRRALGSAGLSVGCTLPQLLFDSWSSGQF
ncbi:hypothetical protein MJT46_005461, partial [Ovis ammon polii x Ovis aries]